MSEIVRLNVGGRQFATSRHTLLSSGKSFFSVLLDGRLPSCKDESGAFFIDRDPDLFSVILGYLRSGELNPRNIDLGTLKNEAQFYGLESLVKKLSLCEENFSGSCGDLLFHAYMPPPELPPVEPINGSNSTQSGADPQDHACFLTPMSTSSTGSWNPSPNVEDPHTQAVTFRSAHPTQPSSFPLPPSHQNANEAQDAHSNTMDHGTELSRLSTPVTLITCHQNIMAAVYKDCVGVFYLKDPTGWRLVWLSPRLAAPIHRIALTAKTTSAIGLSGFYPNPVTNAPSSLTLTQTLSGQPHVVSTPCGPYGVNYGSAAGAVGTSPRVIINAAPTISSACLVACAMGPKIVVWSLYPHRSTCTSAVAFCASTLGVATSPSSGCLSPLTPLLHPSDRLGHRTSLVRSKEPWTHDLVGRYDLNGRAVDYLMFIDAHLVALSRRGLVGVRHVMTSMWQVWSTVPILSYSVAASELLLLGCANGRICSINIQKFPLRIVDNDLLVTEMYRDPLQDPVTALSMHFTKTTPASRSCIEIAYGTLSGRVCLIVQYPENVGYSPQLLQTFTVHRAMVTRVVLSEKHLISMCSESNHVRTWSITRFRGVISTHPGCIPIASFHITALDTTSPQTAVDSVLDLLRSCSIKSGTKVLSCDVVRTHSSTTFPQSSTVQRQSQPTPSQPAPQQQQRSQRHSQPFRLAYWRRHGSHSRSPVTSTSETRPTVSQTDTSQASGEHRELVQSVEMRSHTNVLEHPSLHQTPMVLGSGICMDTVVALPRTSWLHEDLGNGSGRTSLVVGNQLMLDDYELQQDPASFSATHAYDGPTASGVSVSRCQTFHGTTTDFINSRIPVRSAPHQSSSRKCPPKSSIELHRYANDPGPYGDREDVLVFIQKFTPVACELFVRLASVGKRVCTIQSVNGAPISSFFVHEHDGSNRIGALARRYIFTGHTDGSIQVWDLTTALAQLKLTSGTVPCNTSVMTFDTGAGSSDIAAGSLSIGIMNAPPPFGALQTGYSTALHPSLPNGSGGPTSRELMRLLESCQLGTSCLSSTVVNVSRDQMTLSDSLNSVCSTASSVPVVP